MKSGPTLVTRLDELMLLRQLAEALSAYDAQLKQIRAAALERREVVQSLEVLCAKAEVDMLLGLWRLRFGPRRHLASSVTFESWVASPDRARMAGAV